MYSGRNAVYILTMLESIEKLRLATIEIAKPEDFFSHRDQLLLSGCMMQLIVIGEESRKINQDLKDEFAETPWKMMLGMRNIISHDYRGTSPDIVFEVIKNHLDGLKTSLRQMLNKVDFPKEKLSIALASRHYSNLKYLIEEE